MKTLKIQSQIRDFEVKFVEDFTFVDSLSKIKDSVVIVGTNVYSIYKRKIFDKFPKEKLLVVELGEKNKTLDTVIMMYASLLEKTAKKNLTIISFGGGVNQDVVGFLTSTLYRGINWIFVPTTLLAMADSAIGLKTSLNFKSYKNVIGTFYPPSEIYINVDFLKTLPKLNYYSGVGEIVKFFLMKKNPFEELEGSLKKISILKKGKDKKEILKIIDESMKIKLSYMERDEFDKGKRNLLNYGHEFGHALESASDFDIPHGVVVIIGIIFANIVSVKRGLISKKNFEELNNKLLLNSIPLDSLKLRKKYFEKNILLENMKKDKKRIDNKLVLVLPQKNFSLTKVNNLTVDEYESGLIELRELLSI